MKKKDGVARQTVNCREEVIDVRNRIVTCERMKTGIEVGGKRQKRGRRKGILIAAGAT